MLFSCLTQGLVHLQDLQRGTRRYSSIPSPGAVLPITSCPGLYGPCVQSSALGLYQQRGRDVPDQTIPVASQTYLPKLSMWLLPKPSGDQCLLLAKDRIQLQRHLHTLTLRPLHAGVYTRAGVSSQQSLEMGYRVWWPETAWVSSGHQCAGSRCAAGLMPYSFKGEGEGKPKALTWHQMFMLNQLK